MVAPAPSENPRLAELQSKVAKLGYALRMRYLQRSEGGKIPNVFNAWLLDRDIRDPSQRTLDVRVLLTRDQLSDLHDVLQAVDHPRLGRLAVAAGAADLLVIRFHGSGDVGVQHKADVLLVDAHAEGVGRQHPVTGL